jgi:integrase
MLTWVWRNHAPRAGLVDVQSPWWKERWVVSYSSGKREHMPRLDELARTLVAAERHRVLGSTGQETTDGTLAALWAVILTGQRTGALSGTRRSTILPDPDRPGWQIWTWTGEEMKGSRSGRAKARPHALPMPPEALRILQRFDLDPNSEWVFPSRVAGKHVTSDGINGLMYRLQGKSKENKKVVTHRAENLFQRYEIRPWVPHDVRRTLSTFLDELRLGGAGSAIIAHKDGKGEERELAQAITVRHYIKSQKLDLKALGMTAWVEAVIAAYEAEKQRLEPQIVSAA